MLSFRVLFLQPISFVNWERLQNHSPLMTLSFFGKIKVSIQYKQNDPNNWYADQMTDE